MNVCFVSCATEFWGAEKSMVAIAKGVSNYAITDAICINSRLSRELRSAGIPESRVRLLPNLRNRYLRALTCVVVALLQAKSTVVVCFSSDLLPFLWFVKPILRARRIRVILDLHDVFKTEKGRARLQFYTREIDACIGVSQFVLEQVPNVPNRVVVHRPMPVAEIDLSESSVHGVPETQPEIPVICVAGRVSPDKNLELLLDALMGIRQPFSVVIRGDAPSGAEDYAARLKAIALDRFGDRVAFDGYVEQERLFDGVDILVLLNQNEPSGRVVAEAQCVGCPVVVPNQGGAPEFVDHLSTGFVYEANSSDDLTRTLQKALSSRELLQHIGLKGRSHAATAYRPEVAISKYTRQIRLIASGGDLA